MSGITGIDHAQLTIRTRHEEAARQFYGTLLGLQEIPKPEVLQGRGGLWFQVGPVQLHLGAMDTPTPDGRAHIAFHTSDLGEIRKRLEGASVPTADDVPLPGRHRFFAFDPWGNRLEFVQPF